MSDWFYEKIIDPMNAWAEKHPNFPLIISTIALVISIGNLILRIVQL